EDIATNKRPAGTVQNPVTLYPSTGRKRPAKKPGKPAKPIDWNKAKMGDTFASASLPDIAGKAFTIQASVEIEPGKKANGIILAHGGSAVGYALYAKDGNLFFAVRLGQNAVQKIAFGSPEEKMEITASLTKGKLSIQVGEKTVEAKSHGLLNKHPQEDICIGHDDKNPVDTEAPKGPINGKLSSLKVSVGTK
ncbi:MAG: hypothetical protein QF745_09260, partial [Planctomycetota bacterium]|nr:hypothetical protein [Planctomycetota bacterium]